jgi:hypothetical protein
VAAVLLFSGPCDLANQSAVAAAYNFYATTSITAGDVVVWDGSTAYAVKTISEASSVYVAGVSAQSVSSGNNCVIRQDGGRVAVNVTGSVDPATNPYLITSSTTGKAQGVSAFQSGIFAIAITSDGTPAAGQVYASVNLGFLGYGSSGGGGGVSDHGALTGLSDDDHLQYHNDTRGDARYYTETELDAGQLDTRYYTETESDATFAPIAEGTTNGDSHDHAGGDGAQVNHGGLGGLSDDDHSQYHNDTRGDARYLYRENVGAFTPDADYEPATKKYVDDNIGGGGDHGTLTGLDDADHNASYYTETEMNAHDHLGGPEATVDHGSLTGLGDDDHAAVYAAIANEVTNGDTHDHAGGDGAQVDHGGLGGLSDDDHYGVTKPRVMFTITSPLDLVDAATTCVFQNKSGRTLNITAIYSQSDTDNVDFTLKETSGNDYTSLTTIEAITISTDGTGVYYNDLTSGIDHTAIQDGNDIVFDNDATDAPDWIAVVILGYFS